MRQVIKSEFGHKLLDQSGCFGMDDITEWDLHLLVSSDISLSINDGFIDVCVSELSNSLLWGSMLKLQSREQESQGECQ